MTKERVVIHWFRRDLRIEDNVALHYALQENITLLPIFIFDEDILAKLDNPEDGRVNFIHQSLAKLNEKLFVAGSSICVKYGKVDSVFSQILEEYEVKAVYTNRDYEPYALSRDSFIKDFLREKGIDFYSFKDHVIFEKEEILTDGEDFYKIFTPYRNKWMSKFEGVKDLKFETQTIFQNSLKRIFTLPSLESMGFKSGFIKIPPVDIPDYIIDQYSINRDFPGINGTSKLGIHLRFGTISIRELARKAFKLNTTFLNELIWRDFYSMILSAFPWVAKRSFKPAYDAIPWINDLADFEKWCEGMTGYPIVDAGMRELNTTGYMHNRVRMITASFLTKHLLIDWKWGEQYFASKLLDFDLASNNGGWQWAAGTGTDAQPYFRVFSPTSQTLKFDAQFEYIKKWVPEWQSLQYPKPIVEHSFARKRAIEVYKNALGTSSS